MTDDRDRPPRPPPEPPPTIGYLRAQGVTRFRVFCNEVNCGHGADREVAPVEVFALRIAEGRRHAEVAGEIGRSVRM